MIQSYIRVTYVCCLLGGSAMGQCATKHLWAAPPLEVGHWGEYFHHGNQKCDKSESPYPDPQSQLLNIYQQVTGYNTICLVVCKLQKIPKCEVHTVTLPLPAIAGQVSGLCKWILYTAESNPFSIRSFIMHFCQFLVDIFLNYIHIICCLSHRNSANIWVFPWDWSVSTTITSFSIVMISSGDMKVHIRFPDTKWPRQLWDFSCSFCFDCFSGWVKRCQLSLLFLIAQIVPYLNTYS